MKEAFNPEYQNKNYMKINILKCDSTYSNLFISQWNWKDISTINDWFFRSKLNKGTYTILRMLTCKLR